MNAMQFRDLFAFDTDLVVGQRVCIAWTNCYRTHEATATITKLNAKSVLAAIDQEIRGSNHLAIDGVLYPVGHVIKAPRFVDLQHWTANNCVLPLEEA